MSSSNYLVTPAEAGTRLDKFLAAPDRLGSRGKAFSALERGKVFVNGAEVGPGEAAVRVRAGDVVRVWMDRPGSSKPRLRAGRFGDLEVVYEDETILVVNKPAGLLAVPLPDQPDALSVADHVERHLRSHGKRKPFVVHRIDRDTSGLVLFAKNARAQAILKQQFKRREPERVYWAVVYGHPEPPKGTWRDHLAWDRRAMVQKETHPRDPKGSEAISDYAVLETFAGAALLEIRLKTGRRNQIRLQARLRGHTLVGETRYTYGPDALRTIPFGRQALHARRLGFRHPDDGRALVFEAELPEDMGELVRELRGTQKEERRKKKDEK